ncbi:hypothetical protein [uncultured Mucilaginibacter sp.]|uniref:hypothetical protein n=1 Tax=uncultured Mucilaginibacter sp. TaxID=797541 RepID=UPI0025CDCB7E|nr:hypothetical protein [uncultured Mucilaginibacter sp.]
MKYLSFFALLFLVVSAYGQTNNAYQVVKSTADSISNTNKHDDMENRFFTRKQFADGFGKEIVAASEVYERRKKDGIKDYALATYDFDFISDSKNKLDSLGDFLLLTLVIKSRK